MTAVCKITGNTQSLTSTANVIALANSYGNQVGATSVLIYNSNTSILGLVLSNTQGNFTFACPPGEVIILSKNSSDALSCNTAAANGYLIVNCIERTPD
jgi:hypothetical protein